VRAGRDLLEAAGDVDGVAEEAEDPAAAHAAQRRHCYVTRRQVDAHARAVQVGDGGRGACGEAERADGGGGAVIGGGDGEVAVGLDEAHDVY
jgi:hypothetical protein